MTHVWLKKVVLGKVQEIKSRIVTELEDIISYAREEEGGENLVSVKQEENDESDVFLYENSVAGRQVDPYVN